MTERGNERGSTRASETKEHPMNDERHPRNPRRGLRGGAIGRVSAWAAIAAVATSGACSIFDRESRPQASYMLAPPEQQPVSGEKAASIQVRRFSAVPPFDERPFLYRTTDGTWRADAGAGFIALPSDMMMVALARALERSGRAAMVGIEGTPLRFDFALDGVIEAFYADYSVAGSPEAVVALRGYLVDRRTPGGVLIAQVSGDGRAPIRGDRSGDVADAFSAASGAAIAELLEALPKGRLDGGADDGDRAR